MAYGEPDCPYERQADFEERAREELASTLSCFVQFLDYLSRPHESAQDDGHLVAWAATFHEMAVED